MNPVRIRARSSIADPELARAAVVDLPTSTSSRWLHVPRAVLAAIVSKRGASGLDPERVIVLTLVPVAARRR